MDPLRQYARTWNRPDDTNFAVACFDMNTLDELRQALAQRAADRTDCATWQIRPCEWRAALQAALSQLLVDVEAADAS